MAVPQTGRERPAIAAEAFLRALADHGVDYFFANPGTDFPPIVEAFSRAKKTNAKVPKPILVPHENLAVADGRNGDVLLAQRLSNGDEADGFHSDYSSEPEA